MHLPITHANNTHINANDTHTNLNNIHNVYNTHNVYLQRQRKIEREREEGNSLTYIHNYTHSAQNERGGR